MNRLLFSPPPPSLPPAALLHLSEVLLLGFTLLSLGCCACRRASDPAGDFDDEMEDRGDNVSRSASLLIPATRLASPAERGFCSTSSGTSGAGDDNAVVSVGSTEGVSAAAMGVAADASAAPAPFSPLAAAAPLLIHLNRLLLENKLFIAVNWLPLVPNCLTYFLHPSQVLYTFLFTNDHLVLHAVSPRSPLPTPVS